MTQPGDRLHPTVLLMAGAHFMVDGYGNIYAPLPGWGKFLLRVLVALLVLGTVLWWIAGPDAFWLSAGPWAKIGRLLMVVVGGALAYFAALWLVGFRLADFNRREGA